MLQVPQVRLQFAATLRLLHLPFLSFLWHLEGLPFFLIFPHFP